MATKAIILCNENKSILILLFLYRELLTVP